MFAFYDARRRSTEQVYIYIERGRETNDKLSKLTETAYEGVKNHYYHFQLILKKKPHQQQFNRIFFFERDRYNFRSSIDVCTTH